ncbi:MAG: hypothetical protein WD065_03575, partial [Planctomycetaceae bacterium]
MPSPLRSSAKICGPHASAVDVQRSGKFIKIARSGLREFQKRHFSRRKRKKVLAFAADMVR